MMILCSEIVKNYDGSIWGYNSPFMYSQIFRNNCRFDDILEPLKCPQLNMTIFPQDKAYALDWDEFDKFFKSEETEYVLEKIKESYFIHLYDHASKKIKLKTTSQAAYIEIAHKFCPSILSDAGKYF